MDISTLIIQNKKDRYLLEIQYTENEKIINELKDIIKKLDKPNENNIDKFNNKIDEMEKLSLKKLFYRLKEPQKKNLIHKYIINKLQISSEKADIFSENILELLTNTTLKSKDIIYDIENAEITDIKNIEIIKNNDNIELKIKEKKKKS